MVLGQKTKSSKGKSKIARKNGSDINKPGKVQKFLSVLGPGVITGASDDDPSGIVTYAQAGAQFGYAPLWTVFITFPLMTAVQCICARIGIVTGRGLAGVIGDNYPRALLIFMVSLLVIANTINAGADLGAIAAGMHLIFPRVDAVLAVMPVTFVILAVMTFGSYKQIESVFKWLTLALFCYLASALMTHPDWSKVMTNFFVPHIELTHDYAMMIVAILGTSISPYLFFWQTESAVEADHENKKKGKTESLTEKVKDAKIDVNVGIFISHMVMFFIILSSAVTLHDQGIKDVTSAQQAAMALKPVAGDFAYVLFALALIGTGMLAVPILVGSSAYALSTTFNWQRGFDQKWYQARLFYLLLAVMACIGMGLNFLKLNPMTMLYWTAILNGVLAPPMLFLIMHISNNKKIMGKQTNSLKTNVLGYITAAFMSLAIVAMCLPK